MASSFSAASTAAAASALSAPSEESLRVACYCEENVWRLAYRKIHTGVPFQIRNYYVAFISNERQCVPMKYQVASNDPVEACFWDYHVVLIEHRGDATVVWDMDSRLPYSCPLDSYLQKTFPHATFNSNHPYAPRFRIVDAAVYLTHFSSDRMHMYDNNTGTWSAPPPKYPCVQSDDSSNGETSNLSRYCDMTNDRISNSTEATGWTEKAAHPYGVVLDVCELRHCFQSAS